MHVAVTTAAQDPSSMTSAERLQEVSRLFALAYLRLLIARRESQNPLAESAESEAPCDRTVNTIEETEEVT